ncbi:MAG: ornithine carbamoyltransferase [Phycisphaerales bacterium]|jgi:ornithine carbamoyltransferase|nr:ornithine carbamoyltransferase [Phycisphaerales bacterium]
MLKDFISIEDLNSEQVSGLIDRAIADKALFRAGQLPTSLSGRTLAMIFEKPSLRTRVSFEVAMTHLGGHAIYLAPADIGLGSREPVIDVARVLGRMCDGIMARTFAHDTVRQLAQHAQVPVINALSDMLHPCQAMADLMTVKEHFGTLDGQTLLFVGDGNNVACSLAMACAKVGMKFIIACPDNYHMPADFLTTVRAIGGDDCCTVTSDATEAASRSSVLYTDTWVSMGQEDEKHQRIKDFENFKIDADLMSAAPDNAIVMHCLPAYRGLEITDDVFEKHAETIMSEAENRLHFQRTLLHTLIADGGIG